MESVDSSFQTTIKSVVSLRVWTTCSSGMLVSRLQSRYVRDTGWDVRNWANSRLVQGAQNNIIFSYFRSTILDKFNPLIPLRKCVKIGSLFCKILTDFLKLFLRTKLLTPLKTFSPKGGGPFTTLVLTSGWSLDPELWSNWADRRSRQENFKALLDRLTGTDLVKVTHNMSDSYDRMALMFKGGLNSYSCSDQFISDFHWLTIVRYF